MTPKETLIKLLFRLHELEEECSVKESKLPNEISDIHSKLLEINSYDTEQLIGEVAVAIYEVYKNDSDRIVSQGYL